MQIHSFSLQELLKQFLLIYRYCTCNFLFHKKDEYTSYRIAFIFLYLLDLDTDFFFLFQYSEYILFNWYLDYFFSFCLLSISLISRALFLMRSLASLEVRTREIHLLDSSYFPIRRASSAIR